MAITNKIFSFLKKTRVLPELFIKAVKHSYLLCRSRKTGNQKDSINYVESHSKLLMSFEFLILCLAFVAHTELERGCSAVNYLFSFSVGASSAMIRIKRHCYTAGLNFCEISQ